MFVFLDGGVSGGKQLVGGKLPEQRQTNRNQYPDN